MTFIHYLHINNLLIKIKERIQIALGDNLIGFYLHGSATAEGFDPNLSDIDLVAIIKNNFTEKEFDSLRKTHKQLSTDYSEWKDRIEVVYITRDGLKNFREKKSEAVVISPGEPFHRKEIGNEWLINCYVIQQNGVTILGPDVKNIFPKISTTEYKNAIKQQVLLWQNSLDEYTPQSTRGSVAYAIFTLCRAMYSYEHGIQASKLISAEWVATKFPQWENLINEAIEWRKVQWKENQKVVGDKLPSVLKFLKFITNQIRG